MSDGSHTCNTPTRINNFQLLLNNNFNPDSKEIRYLATKETEGRYKKETMTNLTCEGGVNCDGSLNQRRKYNERGRKKKKRSIE